VVRHEPFDPFVNGGVRTHRRLQGQLDRPWRSGMLGAGHSRWAARTLILRRPSARYPFFIRVEPSTGPATCAVNSRALEGSIPIEHVRDDETRLVSFPSSSGPCRAVGFHECPHLAGCVPFFVGVVSGTTTSLGRARRSSRFFISRVAQGTHIRTIFWSVSLPSSSGLCRAHHLKHMAARGANCFAPFFIRITPRRAPDRAC
jgi:hypothetical protein